MKKQKTPIELLSESKGGITITLTEALDHALREASKAMMKEIPSGTVKDSKGVEHCVMCHRTVGTSAFYCKFCGQKLRQVSDWARISFEEDGDSL